MGLLASGESDILLSTDTGSFSLFSTHPIAKIAIANALTVNTLINLMD